MKKIFLLIIALIVFLSVKPAVVRADDSESDPAAQITGFTAAQQDERAHILKAFLHANNSPLEYEANTFVEEADRNNLDWRLVAAIAGTESTFGKVLPKNSFNAWGWGIPTGADDGVHFKDWKDGIAQVSEGLRENYYGKGAKNVYDVGWIYAANGDSWGTHVQYFMDQISSFVPNDPQFLNVYL